MITVLSNAVKRQSGSMIKRMLYVLLLLGTVGCSALQLSNPTTQTEANISATVESLVDAQLATIDASNALDITADLTPTTSITPEPTNTPTRIPSSATVNVFGTVPIDSESLNSITAMTHSSDGHLLVSLRNGDIYRLPDDNGDDIADDVMRVFEDTDNVIGQVHGIYSDGAMLYVMHGQTLSLLQDTNTDSLYDTVTTLSDALPQNDTLLRANNSIISAGNTRRYFTADVESGDILLITLGDD
mgnify:CR=1 FL=1